MGFEIYLFGKDLDPDLLLLSRSYQFVYYQSLFSLTRGVINQMLCIIVMPLHFVKQLSTLV